MQEKQLTQDEMYWNIDRTATHNCLFNFIVGNRGGGKSYGGKGWVLKKFIKNGEQFIYVRRHEEELTETISKFFADISREFPDYEYNRIGNVLYFRKMLADGENRKWTEDDVCGYAIQLSTATKKKSIPFPKVTTILVDEFLLEETRSQQYLSNEVGAFMELYETIARPGTDHPDVTVWFLGNAISITNPYFVEFNLKLPNRIDKNGKRIWKHPNGDILVEFVKNEKFVKAKEASRFGKMINGTKYAAYSIHNEFLLDDDTFIEKRSKKAKHSFNFNYKNKTYGVWYDYTEGKMWVSESYDPSGVTFSFTTQDHNANTMLLKSRNKSSYLRPFFECFKAARLRFENMNIKNNCYEFLSVAWS